MVLTSRKYWSAERDDLWRLRVNGLVRRLEGIHTLRAHHYGIRVALFFTKTHHVKRVSAAALRDELAPPPLPASAVSRHTG